jgi:hypothetical protein
MLSTAVIAASCTAGIAFCLWFLIALGKERKYRKIGFPERLSANASEDAPPGLLRELERWFREAA